MRLFPLLLATAALAAAGCQPKTEAPPAEPAPAPAPAGPTIAAADTAVWDVAGEGVKTASGLRYWDLEKGTGTVAKSGMTVSVHYIGRLEDGTVFDSSYGRGQPIVFALGKGMVIRGWDEGIAGMREGGKRKLVIPAHLAYGDQSPGAGIPPNATLVFQVTLVHAN